jgi:hypothetical protein
MDYRKLKDVPKKNCFPLPRSEDNFDILAGAEWSSTLDLKSGYWQVDVYPNDEEKTAFSIGQELWRFIIMPLASATLRRLRMSNGDTPAKSHDDSYLVYLDDVIELAALSNNTCSTCGKCYSCSEKPPKTHSVAMSTLGEGDTVPRTYCIVRRGKHHPEKLKTTREFF